MTDELETINAAPLAYFDALYQGHISPPSSDRRRNQVILCLLAISGHPADNKMRLEKDLRDVLSETGYIDQPDVFGACLLLILERLDDGWLTENKENSQLRGRVVSFLDKVLEPEIYKELRIDKSKQTHEKLPELITYVTSFGKQLLAANAELTSLERFKAHREALMKILSQKLGLLLAKPFLPSDYLPTLKELYKRVETYIGVRDTLEVFAAYEDALHHLSAVEEQLSQVGTYYATLLKDIVSKLRRMVEADFLSSEAAQPGNIIIERNTKKYPLGAAGKHIDIVFTVRNSGSGYAYDARLVLVAEEPICTGNPTMLGKIAPRSSHTVPIPVELTANYSEVSEVIVGVYWRNYGADDDQYSEFSFIIEAQRPDVDWETLEQTEPYPLAPITTKHDLVGRSTDINDLIALTQTAKEVGSGYITGQKRVGKTSIARALQSHLLENDYIVIYLEGDYIQDSPENTIEDLGRRVCQQVREQDAEFAAVSLPTFERSLSPLRDFLDVALKIKQRRIVVILDEFDEIPTGLYGSSDLASAFFLALRNTSSRSSIGFVLVGGEKMELIFQSQGMHLNKWKKYSVDYFEFNSDYRELVQRPVEGMLEYSEDALRAIYQYTAGNPYFTKLLCGYIYREAVARRDCYITELEVQSAIRVTVNEVGANTFQHFWDDGIDKRADNVEDRRERRRRVLIALCDSMQHCRTATIDQVAQHKLVTGYGRTFVASELDEFVRRKVLVSDSSGSFHFKVPLFHEWLESHGTQEVLSSFVKADVALRERNEEEQRRIKPDEITDLIASWDTRYYNGMQITADLIRTWLDQFGDLRRQRAMFSILKGLKFYSDGHIRQTLQDAHETSVIPGLVRHAEPRQRKRDDIVVSYLVGVGKSGADLARMYARHNDIKLDNVIERGKLGKRLRVLPEVNALVIADDFVGTGNQLTEELKTLDRQIGEIVCEKGIRVVVIAIVAVDEGEKAIDRTLTELRMPVTLYVGHSLGDEDKCFSERSAMFSSASDREFARQVAYEYGELLWPNNPLGYGNQGLAVVFENSCPNNSLPILWFEGTDKNTGVRWKPLFKR